MNPLLFARVVLLPRAQYAYCHPNGLVVIGITRLHPLASPGLWDIRDAGGGQQQTVSSSGPGDASASMEAAPAVAAAAPAAAPAAAVAAAESDGNGTANDSAEPTESQDLADAGNKDSAEADDAAVVIDFSTKKSDYSAKKVSGRKANKGGSVLHPETVVCKVTPPCGEGRCFKLRALARSFLLEVNERLQEEPELLHTR